MMFYFSNCIHCLFDLPYLIQLEGVEKNGIILIYMQWEGKKEGGRLRYFRGSNWWDMSCLQKEFLLASEFQPVNSRHLWPIWPTCVQFCKPVIKHSFVLSSPPPPIFVAPLLHLIFQNIWWTESGLTLHNRIKHCVISCQELQCFSPFLSDNHLSLVISVSGILSIQEVGETLYILWPECNMHFVQLVGLMFWYITVQIHLMNHRCFAIVITCQIFPTNLDVFLIEMLIYKQARSLFQ